MTRLCWRARVTDDPADFTRGFRRLVIWRQIGEQVEQVTGFTEQGDAIVTKIPEGVMPDFRGFCLPSEFFEALGEELKPGPSTAELARLEDALAVERNRLDRVLSLALGAGVDALEASP